MYINPPHSFSVYATPREVVGYTFDGLEVWSWDCPDGLSFCLWSTTRHKKKSEMSISLEWNKTARGKRRPYLSICLFGRQVQIGWLF